MYSFEAFHILNLFQLIIIVFSFSMSKLLQFGQWFPYLSTTICVKSLFSSPILSFPWFKMQNHPPGSLNSSQ